MTYSLIENPITHFALLLSDTCNFGIKTIFNITFDLIVYFDK